LVDNPFSAEPVPVDTRIACRIEYDGHSYNGWQSQPHPGVITVQDKLEAALTDIAATSIRVHCAGRTDTGVHAFSQIIHFDAPVSRSCKAWVMGGNASLPRDIRIHWATPVASTFHARFSAQARCYRYVIANTQIQPAMLWRQVTWHRSPLDEQAMDAASQTLLGEQDFSAFRAASCQSSTPMRNVQSIGVRRRGDLLVLEIVANAFLYHMVRNIAGALLAVGDGRKPLKWIEELMDGRDRRAGAETAPPSGLYLVAVQYPAHFGLPATPYGPPLIDTHTETQPSL
jgi:tRNA pseudouridine38-40 synthase